MLLSRLLSLLPDCRAVGETERNVCRLVSHSALADEKTVFADLCSDFEKGTAHCFDAVSRGCRVILRSEKCGKIGLIKGLTVILSENPVKNAVKASYLLLDSPETKIRLCAVTGTKGKSTVCETVRHLLTEKGIPCLSVGTLGVGGISYPALNNTTPDATVLADILSRAVSAGIRYGVIEVSSQALEKGRVLGLSFPVCGFTAFSPDHIGEGEHPTEEAYFLAKRSLFTDYGCETAVGNADDPVTVLMLSGIPKTLLRGKAKRADFHLQRLTETGFSYNRRQVVFPYPGGFFATDALIALAMSSALTGLPAEYFSPCLSSVFLPGRYEIFSISGRRCLIDFAHNGASFDAVLCEERRHTKGKIVCVFGSVGGRTVGRRSELARSACQFADYSVITSDNPAFEDPLGICAEIYSAFPDKTKARIVVDRESAIRYAFSLLDEDDSLLLLGKGAERTQDVRGKSLPFSEKNILRSLDSCARV